MLRILVCIFAMPFILIGCGGGSSSRSVAPAPATPTPPLVANDAADFDQGIFRNSDIYKDQCQTPRVGPTFPDVQGSTADENNWLRAWSNELYLWYDEIADSDPTASNTPAYFDLMKTFAVTLSGAARDQFHFTFDTERWIQLSQSGISAGYGSDFLLLSSSAPREVVVSFVEPGSPAAAAGLARGTRLLEVDGVDVINGSDVTTLNAGLFPTMAGQSHSFAITDFGGANSRTVTMVSAEIAQDPVPTTSVVNTPSGPVGYLLFNSHIATAEQRLIDEVEAFQAAGITELILDMRYNGGGFLDIANELAFMIAGPAAASGRVFDETQFSDKHPTTNPVTGAALTPDFFHETSQGFSAGAGVPLPSLNLSRVFVLASEGTCSASEAIINGLRGIDVEVILIGDPTCGKPYGFFPFDNCGTTYFSVQFRGVNAKGFGDYADGFFPMEGAVEDSTVEGCPMIPDDFSNELGDVTEARLAKALEYIDTGECDPLGTNSTNTASQLRVQKASIGSSINNPNQLPGTIKRR